jgi:hypothetical protein
MKKALKVTLVTLFFALPIWANAQYNIVGSWIEVEDDDTSYLTFSSDGHFSLLIEGISMDGHGYSYGGDSAVAKYTVKYDGKTCKFDSYIILIEKDSTVAMFIPALAEFVDANTIKMNWNWGNMEVDNLSAEKIEKLRPKDVNDSEDTMLLKRVSNM